jgi:hypothetical protein
MEEQRTAGLNATPEQNLEEITRLLGLENSTGMKYIGSRYSQFRMA